MAHEKMFAAIPMSKSMRDMCREEDYAFLKGQKSGPAARTPESTVYEEWQESKEERLRGRLEREQQEQERQCELERERREKEEKWKSHVAELASVRESLNHRLQRLREFRNFQKGVLMQDLNLDPETSNEKLTHLLMRL